MDSVVVYRLLYNTVRGALVLVKDPSHHHNSIQRRKNEDCANEKCGFFGQFYSER